MANDSDVWKCHPDLEMEWKEFVSDSRASVGNDLNSDLWMNYWRSEIPSAKTNHTAVYSLISPPESEEVMSYESSGQNMKIILSSDNEEGVGPQEAQEVLLSESQCQHIQSISCDLVDALDMTCENIPSDLKDDMRSLSPSEMVFLFKELQSKLSDQGAYALCSLLTEDADVREWVNIAIVFEGLFLYKLQQCGLNSINQELLASLKQLAVHFPTECVSSFLKPLIICEMSPIHLELVSGLVPLLPEKDFSSLFQHVVGTCKTPIEEQMISILNCLLSDGRAHVFESRTESPLLDLLPILSSSARALSASESFASLLLKVIPVLRKNPSSKVKNELLAVVQLNTSFSNQILMDALS